MINLPKQIGAAARQLGINPKTIRYYEEISLIPPAQRTTAGYRVYAPEDIDRIAFILRARELDFSLDDIGEILALRENGEAPCLYVMELVQKQMAIIDKRIATLNHFRRELADVQQQAQTISPTIIADKECVCHLIENRKLKV